MNDVTVQYGDKLILDKINWKVKRGERWALRGHNGSGKSTLLSLILADNPKAYSNELYLFDRKRGSGESIWDIKAKIGQISPELHIFFQRNTNYTEALSMAGGGSDNSFSSSSSVTCFEVVCSGFYEQVGSSYELASLQYKYAEEWMELLKISSFKKQPLGSLSLGQQRLVLLARALVKNPPLLILDDPCQGLDAAQTKHFVNIVDELCKYSDKTLIYVSHYVEDIPSCVDHMLVLEDGRVKE
jgi:molybdate transport system ATP-binding protein